MSRWVILLVIVALAGCQASTPVLSPTAKDNRVGDVKTQSATSQPVTQDSKSGDQNTSGNSNTTVGGGNSLNVSGGTIVAIIAIAVPVVTVGYLLGKGVLSFSAGVKRRRASR